MGKAVEQRRRVADRGDAGHAADADRLHVDASRRSATSGTSCPRARWAASSRRLRQPIAATARGAHRAPRSASPRQWRVLVLADDPRRARIASSSPGTDPDVARVVRDARRARARRGLRVRGRGRVRRHRDDRLRPRSRPDHRDRRRDHCAVPRCVARFLDARRPRVPLPLEIAKLTGITDEDVTRARRASRQPSSALAEFVGGRDIVAHNASFDRSFLERVGGTRFPGRWLDSLRARADRLPRLRSHRLSDLAAARSVSRPTDAAHRAPTTSRLSRRVWRVLALRPRRAARGALCPPRAARAEATWPLRETLAHIAAGKPTAPFDLKDVRRGRVRGAARPRPCIDADEIACDCPTRRRSAREFSGTGVCWAACTRASSRAPSRRDMAEAVREAFETRTHLAVEAGPAWEVGRLPRAGRAAALAEPRRRRGRDQDERAHPTSSSTHELPRLAEALGGELRVRRRSRATSTTCACGSSSAPSASSRTPTTRRSRRWRRSRRGSRSRRGATSTRSTCTGAETLRAAVQATQADCTKKRCRYYPHLCYLHGVRRRAASAHVVVTNHALLFRDVVGRRRHPAADAALGRRRGARRRERGAQAADSLGASHAELSAVLGALRSKRAEGCSTRLRRAVVGARCRATPVLGADRPRSRRRSSTRGRRSATRSSTS